MQYWELVKMNATSFVWNLSMFACFFFVNKVKLQGCVNTYMETIF